MVVAEYFDDDNVDYGKTNLLWSSFSADKAQTENDNA